ncbi:MAG: DeoR/GlpR transcriptional regulator [Sphaerochaetaceae bacterium]|nr:DeoR/GlpR transcriptional regulator [Sphaerochaetaceae bacterium]
MANSERLVKLKDYLIQHNGTSIKELSEALAVTEMTVRRDLKLLSDRGDVIINHGVVVYRPHFISIESRAYSVENQKSFMLDQKIRIGKAASELITPDDVIFMDVGTTVECVANAIQQNSPITAMCFAANTFLSLQKKNIGQIIMSGGYYHPSTQAFESEALAPVLKGLRASKAFIAPSAASMEVGLTCSTQYDMQIKKLVISNSIQHIVVLTSDKFGKVKSTGFADWSQIHTVITDSGISPQWIEFIKSKSIELIIV